MPRSGFPLRSGLQRLHIVLQLLSEGKLALGCAAVCESDLERWLGGNCGAQNPMAEDIVHQPNDKLFRSTFSELQNAEAFFRGYLGAELVAAADWGTLRQQEGRFVDDELAGAESDLLFSVSLDGREALIYILFEHQSSEDPWMAFRLLRYMVRIWETQRAAAVGSDGRVKLSPIVPVVLAQGSKAWKTSSRFSALFGDAPLDAHTPDFTFELIQLVALGYEEMRGAPAGILTIAH